MWLVNPYFLQYIPWLIGWLSMSVMGPIITTKFLYHVTHSCLSHILNTEKKLQGKVVVITGASSGLGEALAHALYKRGCRLILAARNVNKLNVIKEDLVKLYRPPEMHMPCVMKLDLEDLHAIPVVAKEIENIYGRVDILINNAGISFRGSAVDTDMSIDIKLMVINYFGPVALTKALLPKMIDTKSGDIITISSIQGKLAMPYRSCYSASKHALQGFFDSLRAEIAGHKINVSVISPGYIRTNLSINAVKADGSNYGVMDTTQALGMTPAYVAEQVIKCLCRKEEEMTLGPVVQRLAILLRLLTPSLFSWLMKRRAVHEKQFYLREKRD